VSAGSRSAPILDPGGRAKPTTKAPADVVDGATGERRKMMRAQLRGAHRY